MNKRFDHRTKDTFKKDIKFGTMLEQYWWARWVHNSYYHSDLEVTNAGDNGCGNDGEFIASGNTAGADFIADVTYKKRTVKQLPIEMKWVPTAGKFTLKEGDLKAYIKEGAAILFIYNSVFCGTDLRRPQDYDFDKYIELIESKLDQIKWGLMWPDDVRDFYQDAKENDGIKPVHYMGGKPGVVLQKKDFIRWFNEEVWK